MSLIVDITIYNRYHQYSIDKINEYTYERNGHTIPLAAGQIPDPMDHAGGSKVYCSTIHVASHNYFPIDEFFEYLDSFNPQGVIVICDQEGLQTVWHRPGPDDDYYTTEQTTIWNNG